MKIRPLATTAAALAATFFLHAPLTTHAQDDAPPPPPAEADGGPGPGGPGPGGPGGDRRAEMRQRMSEFMKKALKASDDEWSVMQPLIEKVREKQREAGGGFGGGPGGFGGRGGGERRRGEGGDQQRGPGDNAVNANGGGERRREGRGGFGGSTQSQDLRAALENDSTSTGDIKVKLQALRDSRKKAATELASAREDLKKVLNLRQEAVLTLAGVLE